MPSALFRVIDTFLERFTEKKTSAGATPMSDMLAITPAPIPDHPYPVGENVFIRAVTMFYTGRLVRVTAGELVLVDAAWIADTGRFSVALATGALIELEPFPPGEVVISRGGLIDRAGSAGLLRSRSTAGRRLPPNRGPTPARRSLGRPGVGRSRWVGP